MRTTTIILGTAGLLQMAALPAYCGVRVRVERGAGGPRITVDGKPVLPWMFFGNPRSGRVRAGREWKKVTFRFSPEVDIPGNGTLHFRFGHVPGDVWVRNVRIVEDATGREVVPPTTFASGEEFRRHWDIWPPDKRNTVGRVEISPPGVLHVKLTAPPGGKSWPDFHIPHKIDLRFRRNQQYTGSFEVRADPPRPVTASVYFVSGGRWIHVTTAGEWGEGNVFLRQVALARDAGVRFITFSCPFYPAAPGEEQYWQRTDELCRRILQVHPRALLIPRIGMGPPGWWYEKHPEARMIFDDDGKPVMQPSVSSRAYRRDAAEWLARFCRHMMETFPDNFAGVHPCGQNTGEWFYYRSWNRPVSGYDAATREAWRRWLADRGIGGAESARVPSPTTRRSAPDGLLRDPAKPDQRLLIEFARFRQREMADTVTALAAAARKATRGEKLVVFFYGYFFEFGAMVQGAHESGHYALSRVLASPDIDILCAPISYGDRQWLGTGPCMSPAESVMAAGKLWLNEDDTRTHLAGTTRFGGVQTVEQARAVLTRNLMQEALRGFGTWWMDLPGQGWFDDRRLWEVMTRLRPLGKAMLERRQTYAPEIALIVGEDSMCCAAYGANVATRPLIYESRWAFGRAALPYGQYMLKDAVAGRVPSRLQVYLAAWSLSSGQRAVLARGDGGAAGTTRVWCWAPGYITPAGVSTRAMKRLTGFTCRRIDLSAARVRATKEGRDLGFPAEWGVRRRVDPLFTASAPGMRVLAVWSDGSPAVAARRRGTGRGYEVFYGVPAFTPETARALARLAGLRPVADADMAVWSAAHFWAVYPLVKGRFDLRLDDEKGRVREWFENKDCGTAPEVRTSVEAGRPEMFQVVPE